MEVFAASVVALAHVGTTVLIVGAAGFALYVLLSIAADVRRIRKVLEKKDAD